MYRVSSTHLSPDGRSTQDGSDAMDRGQMGAAELSALLDAFLDVDAADNEHHDPSIVVSGRGGKLMIRTSRGRLHVYDVRDHAAPSVEMSAGAVLERLDKGTDSKAGAAAADEQPAPTAPHRGIAFAMLIVGLALNGYILYSVFYVKSVNKKVEVKLLTDASEISTKERVLAGTYATGQKTGDRVIEVTADGKVRFYEMGAKGPINDSRDTFRMGRHDGILCLTTDESGVIDLSGDTLVYYRDVYQRRKPPSP